MPSKVSEIMSENIRLAKPSDLAVCRKFDYKKISKAFLKNRIEEKSVFLVFLDGKPVGYLRIEYLWLKVPYIGLIIIEKQHRGKGLGTSMLKFVEKYLRKNGYEYLYSSSQQNESGSQHWHKKLGFRECGQIKDINKGDVNEIFFRKAIE